jgi:cyclic pyranopterin phosphate synthase
MNITHLDENNNPNMVDVGDKSQTRRVAVAKGKIFMSPEAFKAIDSNQIKKGPVLQTAIIASITGAKQTSNLIPMCHPLNIENVKCSVESLDNGYELTVTAKLTGKTGIEMEALTGVSIGLLTIYDMAKAIDKSMVIEDIRLVSKTGGKSGEYKRDV